MNFSHDYSYTNMNLTNAGFAALSFHSLRFERYFTEEEKEQNRAAAERLGTNTPEWSERCKETQKEINRQLQKVIALFSGYDLHQLTEETSTHEHYKTDWDLFFYSNRGWNGSDVFDYMTLSANDKRTAAANMDLLSKVLKMLESADIDAPNIRCVVQYDDIPDNAAIEAAALEIIEKAAGKMIFYNGIEGKIKKYRDGSGVDSFAFFKKGARTNCYRLDPAYIVLNF